jgi:hypothetical protein
LILEDTVHNFLYDVSSDRILYQNDSGVFIRNRQTGTDEAIPHSQNYQLNPRTQSHGTGFLTSDGAFIVVQPDETQWVHLVHWKNGTIFSETVLGTVGGPWLKGNYAVWGDLSNLYRMDLTTEEITLISTDAFSSEADVAENGDVVFMTRQYQIARWRNGQIELFPKDPNLMSSSPVTDGTNIVYRREPLCCNDENHASIRLITPTGDRTLAENPTDWTYPGQEYQINNGWVAYRENRDIWLRSPQGDVKRIVAGSSTHIIMGVSPNGEVLTLSPDGHYYLSDFSTDQPVDLGFFGFFQNEFWKGFRDGAWFVTNELWTGTPYSHDFQYVGAELYRVPSNWKSPFAFNQFLKHWKNDPLPLTLKADSPQGRPLTYSVGAPAHGSLTGAPPHLTYQPDPGFAGADSFTFQVSDGTLSSQAATVSINVVDPQLLIGSATALRGATVSLPVRLAPLAGNVTNLDIHFHVDGTANAPSLMPPLSLTDTTAGWQVVRDSRDPLHISIASPNGISGDASLLTINFFLPTFTPVGAVYTLSATDAQVTDAFGHARSITGSVKEGQVTVGNIVPVANDLSVQAFQDRSTLVTLQGASGDSDPLTYRVVTPPSHGTLFGTPPDLTYAPRIGFSGEDSFTFVANDTYTDSEPATVSLHVQPVLVTIGSAEIGQGERGEIPVSLTGQSDPIKFLDLTLSAGASALEPQWRLAGDGAAWHLQVDPNNPRHVTLTRETPISGPSTLLWLSVRPPANTTIGSTILIYVSGVQLGDPAITTETLRVSPGALTIEACHDRLRGDLNGDGAVGIGDAILALRMAVLLNEPSNECQRAAADVNCDNVIDIGDAVLILRNVVFHEEFPACSG